MNWTYLNLINGVHTLVTGKVHAMLMSFTIKMSYLKLWHDMIQFDIDKYNVQSE